jgi:hypothetical protein
LDNKDGAVRLGSSKDFINTRIAGLLKTYRKKDMELADRRDYMTVSVIKQHLLSGKNNAKEIDFFEFAKEYIKTVTVKGTSDLYKALVASLKIFNGEKLPVSGITVNFLMRYEMYLRSRSVGNGIVNYMRTFRALFNKCRDHFNDEDSVRFFSLSLSI